MQDSNYTTLLLLPLALVTLWCFELFSSLNMAFRFLLGLTLFAILVVASVYLFAYQSSWGRKNQDRKNRLRDLPLELLCANQYGVKMGIDDSLKAQIFLPDKIRNRHVHILGATGSGKTESVILNFLKQDVARGFGSIILDAKGDYSFLTELKNSVPTTKLFIFDLSDSNSLGYDPLQSGTALESSQRLFSSLTWSEEYYKTKALAALQQIFEIHHKSFGRNPMLKEIAIYLETAKTFAATVCPEASQAAALSDYQDLSGLRAQIRSLTIGHLGEILSPTESRIKIENAHEGAVLYFRLQSLMSPQIVSIVGRLLINQLNYLAGNAHRSPPSKPQRMVPVYFDEFASFACLEFADLISKARSAGFALHFSHQSIGDIAEISPGFLNRITDNAATKIVMRINDPDSAEFFARCFGTKHIQKTTQRITNAKNIDAAEIVGEGTTRDAHQFRASPDLLKTLPTGVGAVLIAHGRATPHGASSVFTVRFPELRPTNNSVDSGV